MDQDKLLRSAAAWQKKAPKERTSRLGGEIDSYIAQRQRHLDGNAELVELWEQLLPEQLYKHCRIGSILGGLLELEVESGPYMHEMKLLSDALLEIIQRRCPRARIRAIKLRPINSITD